MKRSRLLTRGLGSRAQSIVPARQSSTPVVAILMATMILALALAAAVAESGQAQITFASFSPKTTESTYAPGADGRECDDPTVHAFFIENGDEVKIDGRLDEILWHKAETACGFSMWDPDRGEPATEQTVFKVAYDDDAVYFAVACLESDPNKISKSLTRRDRMSNSDVVSIYVDPYFDRTTGYNFRVNPLGVQLDAYIYNDGDRDEDWDAVWQAETFEDERGWYTEMRIPFSSIRYREGQETWGLQVYRYMHGRGEDTAWRTWDRETSGFVSRFGKMTGLRQVPAPRQLEILPYAVYRTTDPSVVENDEFDGFQNLGADIKYGVTADLTMNATVQPDFGQVEADPATLNLSPFETFFQEKRPFFTEGSRFFQQRDFNLFYSRRIGTGDENSRIRYAAKVTGKTAGEISVAGLAASTDVTGEGQTHNLFKGGDQTNRYFITRLGKDLNEGNYRVNVMGTAALKSGDRETFGDYGSREAYTGGLDFDLKFRDRSYGLTGSFVGSVIDSEAPSADESDPGDIYGTGGDLTFRKLGGNIRGATWIRWEGDRLNLNDLGFLSAPDERTTALWVQYRYNPDGKSKIFNRGNFNYNLSRSWLYGARTGRDLHTGDVAWSYDAWHPQRVNTNINGWMQFRNYMEFWFGTIYNGTGTQRFDTRNWVLLEDGETYEDIPGGGPLISEPATYGGWMGSNTDTRKSVWFRLGGEYFRDTAGNVTTEVYSGVHWNQSSAIDHELDFNYRNRYDDTQHLHNYENPGGGIGGVSYVYGDIHQQTVDLTLRSSLLFNRNSSLELYLQPFVTVGEYRGARELARPDSYDLKPYDAEGFQASDFDFSYSAVNVNAVYRWEYRPGSTLFLVWTHARSSYDERGEFSDRPGQFRNDIRTGAFFKNEPENRFLAKLTYWIPV